MKDKVSIASTIIVALFILLSLCASLGATITYTYDSLNRILKVQYGDSYTEEYTYDAAGNRTRLNGIDNAPPSGSIKLNSDAIYTKSTSVSLTLSCNDGIGSGCSEMQFSNDCTNWSSPESYNASKSWSLTSGDGTKTVCAKFSDKAGNWSNVYSDSITLDGIAPITTASPQGGTYASAQSVSLTCNDGSGSGCDKIYYTTDGTNPTTGSPVYSGSIGVATNITIRFFAVDLAGNPETAKMQIYVIVTSPLTITTSSLPSGTVGTIYNQTLSASGGAPPYAWSVSSGSLPDGLSLSSSTGAISGTPTKNGTFNPTVRVTDIVPSIAIKNFSIAIGMGSSSVRVIMPPRYFSTIQDAYDACYDGDTVEIKALDFFENLVFDLPGSVILRGGCNADFTSNSSYTTIHGTVTISNGTVEVDHLIIK